MKLRELKRAVDKAVKAAKGYDVDVTACLDGDSYDIQTIAQFRFVPDVVIVLEGVAEATEPAEKPR